ncbi:hypothetical protein PEC301296_41450 [Pectobacterium carotovorum subsp. carotovorum]|nr:hypothetical protein [Pectobacterium atrosepticum]GKV87834.1 hypothetical protein PEC301296_41450 [Pectobacterium carotovorum subsp. carotovorum]KMK82075.1 hypothetical protein KCQ_08531 [Pectobacterium atrosepticum ICMP 1526]MBL0896095.1 hypothetical protein [Pectobacterium atrosepticum]MDK9445064.1 hypothetical protein [Pectobacterium atrosepticum]QWC49318.1 hypothetical protein HLB43_00245 [Pectobacterium atrosepticum]
MQSYLDKSTHKKADEAGSGTHSAHGIFGKGTSCEKMILLNNYLAILVK